MSGAAAASAFNPQQTHEYTAAYGKGEGYLRSHWNEAQPGDNENEFRPAFDPAQTHAYTEAAGKGWGYLTDDPRHGFYEPGRHFGTNETAEENSGETK